MKTYEALAEQTRNAKTVAELQEIEAEHEKHYNRGTISVSELIRLDRMAMNQYVQIIEDTTKPLSSNQ